MKISKARELKNKTIAATINGIYGDYTIEEVNDKKIVMTDAKGCIYNLNPSQIR
jgi:hypothetical protein